VSSGPAASPRGPDTAPLVVKVGGELVRSAEGANSPLRVLSSDIVELDRAVAPVVVVHGGGPQATELQKRLGLQPRMVAGRRVTDADALEVMKMAVAGQVNVDLCAALMAAGGKPVGLHGASSSIIGAHKRPPRIVSGGGAEPIDFGHVGDVDGINHDLLTLLAKHGYIPVVACLGADVSGHIYNINADAVANKMAIALNAHALIVITDVPAVLRDVHNPSSRIARMTASEAGEAIQNGTITKGMVPKLEESFAAIAAGVRSVLIVGRLQPGELVQAVRDPGSVGTLLVG